MRSWPMENWLGIKRIQTDLYCGGRMQAAQNLQDFAEDYVRMDKELKEWRKLYSDLAKDHPRVLAERERQAEQDRRRDGSGRVIDDKQTD